MSSATGRPKNPTKRKYKSDNDDGEPKRHHGEQTTETSDEENSSCSDEEFGNEEIYDASDEPFPIHAAFDPGLKQVTATASKLVQEAHSLLNKYASRSTTLQNMQKNAEETLVPPKSEPPMIAFVGPTGEGKSSAGNAILGVKGLMRTGSAGSSITNVATIYQWSFSNQQQKYAAKILYRSYKECRAVLEDLLTCYKQNYIKSDEDCSKEQRSEYEMHSQEAIKILFGLFCGKSGFQDRKETEKTLDKQVDSDGGMLIEMMLVWCWQYFATLEKHDGVFSVYVEADDSAELENAIRPFTADSAKSQEPARWPLVQEVRVATSESRFLEFVRLVDLPGKFRRHIRRGQSDTNPIRSRAADDNIRKCQGLFVFADIKRAVTDPSLHRTISLYAERFPSTLVVVLTKIDQGIDTGLADIMRDEGENMTAYDQLTDEVSQLKADLSKANNRLNKSRKSSLEERMRLFEQIQKTGIKLTEKENKQFDELVMARNNSTTKRLKRDKQQYFVHNGALRVVHISPVHYEVSTSIAPRRYPLMDVALTGIPKLRDIALMMAGPPLWRARTEYLESQVSVFIHGLKLWSAGCAVQDQSKILSIVEELLYIETNPPLDEMLAHRETIMEKKLLQPLRSHRREARHSALGQLKQLDKWNGHSWNSFYRHFGQHTTDSIGAVSWNELFLQGQTDDTLDPCWHVMVPALHETFCSAKNQVVTSIEETKKKLLKSPASVSLNKTIIGRLFKGVSNGIQSDYDRIADSCKRAALNIKMDATKDRAQSYFTVAMKPGYEAGQHDKGDGRHKRCKARLRQHLSVPLDSPLEPFAIHHRELAKALKEDNRKHTNELQIRVLARTTEIYRQFKAITEQKPETPAEASARKAIEPFLKRALRDIENMEKVLEQIRHKYPAC